MSKKITVQNIEVRMFSQDDRDYICLTDIAKQVDEKTGMVISNWLRNAGTLDFLKEWEEIHNQDFNLLKFEKIRNQAGKVGFVMTSKRWIETTNAVGITAKAGRYGGTYAHKDIAFEFCSAISARFKLYLIQEFDRLKAHEAQRLGYVWDANRYLSRVNYHIHTETIKNNVIPLIDQGTKKEAIFYAVEADLLNQIVFGTTAKQWRMMNPESKGNIRDHANSSELHVLANLEALNAELIRLNYKQPERILILEDAAKRHSAIIAETGIKKLK